MVLIPALIAFAYIGSMVYVYKYRGQARFAGTSEFFRKVWNLFTPINCLLYLFSQPRARQPIMALADYGELAPISENWETIRDEAEALYRDSALEASADPDSPGFYDVGFRTFYKYGWRKFYLNWYGYRHASAASSCPRTCEILEKIPSVRGAMFSLLPPGGQLTRHMDPIACSLRYHLGLSTPNDDRCFINVDEQAYSWRDGEGFLFDETYLHFARNDARQPRLILMCDVERPTHTLGTVIKSLLMPIMRITVVPNNEQDKAGIVNRVFRRIAPVFGWSKRLKQTNRGAYKVLKYSVNATLVVVPIWGLVSVLRLVGLGSGGG